MTWHTTPPAQRLLSTLTEQDLMIIRPCRHDAGMAFAAATDHGANVLAKLADIYSATIAANPLDLVWRDMTNAESVRGAALTELVNSTPTVAAALSSRFGSPDRFRGFDALDATRRFRASFAGVRKAA